MTNRLLHKATNVLSGEEEESNVMNASSNGENKYVYSLSNKVPD